MSDAPHSPLDEASYTAFAAAQRPVGTPTSDRARVRAVLPLIQEKLAAGWSYAEIRDALAQTLGFQGTMKTLYTYVSRLSALTPAREALLASAPSDSSEAGEASTASSSPPPARRFADSLDPTWVDTVRTRRKRTKTPLAERLNEPL